MFPLFWLKRRSILTLVGIVVDENDFPEQMRRRSVKHRMDSPEQHGPGLVMETNDNRGVWQVIQIPSRGLAPETQGIPLGSTTLRH